MKRNAYLLDTHILLWWLTDNQKLSREIRSILTSPESIIYISVVSSWEMAIKLNTNADFKLEISIQDCFIKSGFKTLSITAEHTFQLEKLPLLHKDPFDRMLISQAMVENLILISVDEKLQKYSEVMIIK